MDFFDNFNEALIKGHGDVEFAKMSFESYLDVLSTGVVPNVLPAEIIEFFTNRQ